MLFHVLEDCYAFSKSQTSCFSHTNGNRDGRSHCFFGGSLKAISVSNLDSSNSSLVLMLNRFLIIYFNVHAFLPDALWTFFGKA